MHSVNPLHLIFNIVHGYIEESNENRYLIFASADKNEDVWQNTQNLEFRNLIEKKNGEPGECKK